MRRRVVILVLGVVAGALFRGRAGADALRGAAAEERSAEPTGWSEAAYCTTHARELETAGAGVSHRSPAAEQVVAALYALFLYAPGEGLPVQLLTRGRLAQDGKTLDGDLVLRAVDPTLVRGVELWNAVQAVRRAGLWRIRGRVLFSNEQDPPATRPLPELEPLLKLAGVQLEAPPVGPVVESLGEHRIGSWESAPLLMLLQRDLGVLGGLLPGATAVPGALRNLDPRDTDWLPQSYPNLTPQQVVELVQKGLAHTRVGPELLAAFRPLDLGSGLAARGVVVREERLTELAGVVGLGAHSEVVVDVRADASVSDADLGARLAEILRRQPRPGPRSRAQELPAAQSSSEVTEPLPP